MVFLANKQVVPFSYRLQVSIATWECWEMETHIVGSMPGRGQWNFLTSPISTILWPVLRFYIESAVPTLGFLNMAQHTHYCSTA